MMREDPSRGRPMRYVAEHACISIPLGLTFPLTGQCQCQWPCQPMLAPCTFSQLCWPTLTSHVNPCWSYAHSISHIGPAMSTHVGPMCVRPAASLACLVTLTYPLHAILTADSPAMSALNFHHVDQHCSPPLPHQLPI